MGREVADLAAVGTGVLERRLHGPRRPAPEWVRTDDVERVAGEADSSELRERLRSACGGGRRRLDDEHRSSLAEDETVAIGAERPARLGGEGSEPREAREGDARERIGSAGEDCVGPSEPDEVERVAERVVPGRARSREHDDASAEAELGRDVPADLVGAGADELLGRDGARPHVRRIPRLEPAALSHRGADRETDLRSGEAGLSERLTARGRREQSGAPGSRLARALERETADLAADPGRKPRGVERFDGCRARGSGEKRRPEGLDVRPDGRDDAETGDHRPLDAASCSASRVRVSATRLPNVVIPFSSSTVKLRP